MKKKIAIIGAGISGLGAAYILAPHYDVHVFEKNDRIGGHSRTITVHSGSKSQPVDTGFIVFNDWNYPNLIGLFKRIGVKFEKSNMSFGVSIDNHWLEYSSNALFAQKKNIVRPGFIKMLLDIIRFNKQALVYIERNPEITLRQCMEELRMGSWFREYYILAMGASIWSCPVETIMDFPAATFLRFFRNHGLLNLRKRPQWYTVTGGSREYLKPLIEPLKDKITLNANINRVKAKDAGLQIYFEDDHVQNFDHVIFACHADEAMALIENPTPAQKEVIGAFDYQNNQIIVHSDVSFMPAQRSCWASWIYLSQNRHDIGKTVSLSYWMNNLQNFETPHPILVTLNPGRRPAEALIHDEYAFTHPIFDTKAIKAQEQIPLIQGQNNIWFCGAYQRYGFHEDGLWSAMRVAEGLGVSAPWL